MSTIINQTPADAAEAKQSPAPTNSQTGFDFGQINSGPVAALTLVINNTIGLYVDMMNNYDKIANLETDVQGLSGKASYESSIALGKAQAKQTICQAIGSGLSGFVDAANVGFTQYGNSASKTEIQSANTELTKLKEFEEPVQNKSNDPSLGNELGEGAMVPVAQDQIAARRLNEMKAGTFTNSKVGTEQAQAFDATDSVSPTAQQNWDVSTAQQALDSVHSPKEITKIKKQLDKATDKQFKRINTAETQISNALNKNRLIFEAVKEFATAGTQSGQAYLQKVQGQQQANKTIADMAQQMAGSGFENARQYIGKYYDMIAQMIGSLHAGSNPQG